MESNNNQPKLSTELTQAPNIRKSGLRTPRVSKDGPAGLSIEYNIPAPTLAPTSDEFIQKFGPLPVEVQQALTAVLMLDSPETNIVVDSLNALQKFLKKHDDNKELYIEMGGLPPIQKKMFEKHSVIQRMSMKILALASICHKAKLFMRDMDLAKDLLKLCEVRDDVIVEYATYALSRLASLHTGRVQIVLSDCIPTLVGLLSHNDPDIQRNTLETFWQIAADPLQVALLTDVGVVAPILSLSESEYPPLQAMALLSLEKVACHPEGIATLESLNTFNVIAKILNNETMVDLHRYCLKILFHECRDRGTCKKFAFLVPAITDTVERTTDAMARVNGLELLGRLCSIEVVAKSLAQCGIPRLIHGYLTNTEADLKMREACAFAIAQIARSSFSSKRDFVSSLPSLLELIQNENTSEKGLKSSLVAVSSIIEDTGNAIKEFMKASGFETYKKLMAKHESYAEDVILSALSTINVISGSPPHRPDLIQGGFLPIMLNFLQVAKHPQIHAAVCTLICNILCDSAMHEEFRKLNGPEALLNIINHEEFPVVVAIVPIINVACASPMLAKALLDGGLLQAMWRRGDLISSGPFRACFDRLISANFTLKYAVLGHLSPFERIESGFCDIGGLKQVDELKLPHEYTWEERDPRKRIILLNLGKGKLDESILKNNPSLDNESDISTIIDAVKSQKDHIENEFILVEIIAKAVSDRFGGPLDKWRLTAKAEDIEIESVQNNFRSVIVPVSLLTTGAFRIRSLVFKALCDSVGIPCSLETGDYKKAWNVVLLRPDENYAPLCPCSEESGNNISKDGFVYTENLRRYIVDLVFQPGILMPVGSFEGDTYITSQ